MKVVVFLLLFLLTLQIYGQNNKDYFNTQIALGELVDPQLKEVSGIVAASMVERFWVHNDSGDGANIYLIDSKANLVKTFTLEGINVIDCEDIDRVRIDHKNFLVLADIGNNLRKRNWLCLYVFPEPVIGDSTVIPKQSVKTIFLKFPGQRHLDAESIMIDPLDNMLYVISKREFHSTVYHAAVFSNQKQQYFTLSKTVELPFTFATAATIDPTGKEVLVKNITHIFFWKRKNGEPLPSILRQKPAVLPYKVEPQGEALTFDADGKGFYTISERPFGLKSYLYFFEKNYKQYDQH